MNKLKLKFLTTLTLIGVIFAACEMNEDVISENHYSNDLKIKLYEKKYEQLMTEKKFINSFSKIPKKSSNSILNRTVMEDEYGFTISNKPANVIEMNGDISYTFLIERDSVNTGFFENLVVQTDSLDNTEAYIIKYNLNSDYNITMHNTLNFSATKEITPIIYNNQSSSSSTSSKIIYQETCTVLNYVTCCQAWGGGPTSDCHPAQEACLTSNAGIQYLSSTSETVCSTTEIDLGDTSGGGGSSSGGGASGGGGSVNTSPVNNCRDCIPNYAPTPCDILKEQVDPLGANLVDAIIELQGKLNLPGESGMSLRKNENGVFENIDSESTLDLKLKTMCGEHYYGSIHTHPYPGAVPAFSWADVYSLLKFYNNCYPPNLPEVTIMIVCKDNTGTNQVYALKIDNFDTFWNTLMTEVNQIPDVNNMSEEKIIEYMDKLLTNFYNQNNDKELAFLKRFSNYGISLYKSNNSITNWNKLEIDSINNNQVNPIPCN